MVNPTRVAGAVHRLMDCLGVRQLAIHEDFLQTLLVNRTDRGSKPEKNHSFWTIAHPN